MRIDLKIILIYGMDRFEKTALPMASLKKIIVRKSALYAPTFDKKRRRMLESDFSNPNFPTKDLAKDAGPFRDTVRASALFFFVGRRRQPGYNRHIPHHIP